MKTPKKIKTLPTGLFKTEIAWSEAYPCYEESYRLATREIVSAFRYVSLTDSDFRSFLYEVVRSETLPAFMATNFKKIGKLLEKEIDHRATLFENLSKEQVKAYEAFFRDEDFFNHSPDTEYFAHEIEKVYVDYLEEYLSTGLYESLSRLANRKRKKILKPFEK